MRSRFYVEDPPPADAEVYGNLKFALLSGENGKCCVKAWRGKQGRPYAHYLFISNSVKNCYQKREDWINSEKQAEDGRNEYRKRYEETKAKALNEMLQTIQVGTLLSGSWGYDQTNIELWGVVERRGHAVWIRKVACNVESEGWSQDKLTPKQGEYYGETVKRLITANGVKIHECCTATPCNWTESHHETSYA